jgi:hypothetical protein
MKTPNQGSIEPQLRLKNLAALFAYIAVLLFFRSKVSHDTYIRWGGLVLTIIVIFGVLIRRSREFYRMRSFWKLVAIFVSLNLASFGIALANVAEWKLPWFGIMLIEVPIFIMLRDRLQSE